MELGRWKLGVREASGLHLPAAIFHLLNGFARSTFSLDEKVSQDEQIHLGSKKAVERFFRIADDRFVFVERSVEHEWDAGQVAEMFDQPIIRSEEQTSE